MLICAVLPPETLARSQADLVLYVRDGGRALIRYRPDLGRIRSAAGPDAGRGAAA